jgi:molybdate transport system ATP-binding protein
MSGLEFSATLAARGFDATFAMAPGETVAVLGENGAGKSTLLGLIAGLIAPDSGRATLDGIELFDLASHRRGVSLLAQEALLFPHLTVRENVAFGPRSRGATRPVARGVASRWLREVDGAEFADRRPGQLSGGQAQRVAVARALASDPRLLLLDEPMAALDVTVVPVLRGMLRRVLADRTAIIVTHDVVDAYTLADRVIVMDGGHIIDIGETRAVLGRPRTPFAAALVGLNLISGVSTSTGLTASFDVSAAEPIAAGVPAAATVSPSDVTVSAVEVRGSNVVFGPVESVESRGDLVRLRVSGLAADIRPSQLVHAPGDPAWMSFPPAAVSLYAL